jgi:hypothetical protein
LESEEQVNNNYLQLFSISTARITMGLYIKNTRDSNFLSRRAYSTILTSGSSGSIIKNEYHFCSSPIINAVVGLQ